MEAVQPGAHAARCDLAERDVEQGDPAAERGERVMERVHRAGGGDRGRGGEERGPRRAVGDVLAFHRAVREMRREPGALCLEEADAADGGQPDDRHDREERVTLAVVLYHLAERSWQV